MLLMTCRFAHDVSFLLMTRRIVHDIFHFAYNWSYDLQHNVLPFQSSLACRENISKSSFKKIFMMMSFHIFSHEVHGQSADWN